MDKAYRLMDWLDMEQAVDWLQDLTKVPLSSRALLQLCESGQCAAYADVGGLSSSEIGFDTGTAKGVHLVTNPFEAFGSEWRPREILTKGDTYTQVGASLTFDDIPVWKRAPIFQPSDIQALADKMSGAANQPTAAEIEDLRQQLKQALESRENAWYLTDKYKVELEALRATAEQDRSSREAAWLRAEQAEKLAEEIADQRDRMEAKADYYQDSLEESRAAVAKLNNTVEHEQMARKYAESLAKELRDELEDEYQARMAENMECAESSRCACEQGEAESSPAVGLTFPYATKQLEAMRDAALTHWVEHDRSKPAPYGIQKSVASFLATRTGQNARKLAELAVAIKPDDLPKA